MTCERSNGSKSRRADAPHGTGDGSVPPLVSDSRDLHALRAAAHAPGALIPVAGRELTFTIMHELRDADGC